MFDKEFYPTPILCIIAIFFKKNQENNKLYLDNTYICGKL